MKIIDKLKKVNLIQFVPAIFVISLVGNSVFGYTAPKAKSQKNAGVNQVEAATTAEKKKAKKANAGDIDLSKIKDGTYEGQANGYRGLVKVSVTVKDHKITAIKVLSNSDDAAFFNRASAGVIKNILAKQSLKVDVVSGATYSSNGIIKAVKNALTGEEDKTAAKASGSSKSAGSVGTADESGTYKDGTFTGSASGYHGTVKVSVTIKNNKIKSIKILENHDDAAYFNRAKGILLPLMIKKQSTNVDSVSGATFSSNGIIKAVRNALKKAAVKGSSSSLDSESNSNSTAKKDTTDNVTGVYKDGVYHLFYQYNPYGSMWGNMHWGHAISTDLVNWEHQPIAIAPDALGTIFSGSCVVDKDNTAGFGAGAIIAFYTSASDRQVQSMAYSLDNGKTFKKYARNPILTSTQRDFRDPKVFWHDATDKWIMILAVGQEMQIYSSANLKDWAYESSFGEGQGAHGGVWECPDLIELPIEGTELKKWVLVCNLNPGGPFGGSATQYFVGTFDGKRFVNESPAVTKWMDWGKDHYATVTWSDAPDNRRIAIAWMSNWQYANNVPTTQYRSGNSVPRDLSLYTSAGETYLKSSPSRELLKLRGKEEKKHSFKVDRTYNMDKLLSDNTGTYEIEMTIKNRNAEVIGFQLFNSKGEEVDIYYNLVEKKFAMDRSKSGVVSFSSDFPVLTLAPIEGNSEMTLRLFVDKSSIEAFGDDGRFAMTNLVFPSEPYNRISFYAKGGSYAVSSFKVYKLK